MKITIDQQIPTEEIEYPCLMISNDSVVIYAVEELEDGWLKGFAIYSPNRNVFGITHDAFAKRWFKKFTGTITLSND